MKTTKFFMMAALALSFAACSKEVYDPSQESADDEITITASFDNNSEDQTRALIHDDKNHIVPQWEATDEFAILFNDGKSNVKRIATVVSMDSKAVSITFTIPSSLANNTPFTIVYPASAANDSNTGADVRKALSIQDGSVENCPEVRVGTGKLDVVNHCLTGVQKLSAQNAIFALLLMDMNSEEYVTSTSVMIYDQENKLLTTVTPAAGHERLVYVALPISVTAMKFVVTDEKTTYFNMVSGLVLDSYYYQPLLKLATVGNFIGADGKCYKDTAIAKHRGVTLVAKITYLGDDAETNTTFNHGLALALSDLDESKNWLSKEGTCLANVYSVGQQTKDMAGIANTDAIIAHSSNDHGVCQGVRNYKYNESVDAGTHPAGTSEWFVPSAGQWDKMLTAAGGFSALWKNVNLKEGAYYWSSTENSDARAWAYGGWSGEWYTGRKISDNFARACLAF